MDIILHIAEPLSAEVEARILGIRIDLVRSITLLAETPFALDSLRIAHPRTYILRHHVATVQFWSLAG